MADNINQSISDIRDALDQFIANQAHCCNSREEGTGPISQSGEDVTIGDGPYDQFPTVSAYDVAKCNAANGIYDAVHGAIAWIDENHGDLLTGVFGALSTGLVVGMLLAGPPGWIGLMGTSAIAAICGLLVGGVFAWEDMTDALADIHEEGVNALYSAASAGAAREAFMTVLDGATPALTTPEKLFIRWWFENGLLNQLFSPNDDFKNYESPDGITCAQQADGCTLLKLSDTYPYNVMIKGAVDSMSAGASFDEDGIHLPNAGDWIKFSVTDDTPSIANSTQTWWYKGELYLTGTSYVDGSIKFNPTPNLLNSGNEKIDIFAWPQTLGVWKGGTELGTWVWDIVGGEKPDPVYIQISTPDGSQIIRKFEIRFVDSEQGCPDPEA